MLNTISQVIGVSDIIILYDNFWQKSYVILFNQTHYIIILFYARISLYIKISLGIRGKAGRNLG